MEIHALDIPLTPNPITELDRLGDAIAELSLELGIDGIIATNTTIGREGLTTAAAEVAALGNGGLSGAPLRERSLQVLRRLRVKVGGALKPATDLSSVFSICAGCTRQYEYVYDLR